MGWICYKFQKNPPERSFNSRNLWHAYIQSQQLSRLTCGLSCGQSFTFKHNADLLLRHRPASRPFGVKRAAFGSQQHFLPLFLRSRSRWALMLTVSFSRSRSLSALFWLCFLARSTMWVKAMNICANAAAHQNLQIYWKTSTSSGLTGFLIVIIGHFHAKRKMN